MYKHNGFSFFTLLFGVVILLILSYLVLSWTNTPIGNFMDWLVGVGSLVWLLLIITIPWNIYFEAKEVLNEAKISEKRNINFDVSRLNSVKNIARNSLIIVLFLHLFSVVVLYSLAYFQISQIGYIASVVALLLTFLRPAIRFYEYISYLLYTVRQEVFQPRQDVITLNDDLQNALLRIQELESKFFGEDENNIWAVNINKQIKENQNNIRLLNKNLDNLSNENTKAHENLSHETRKAVAQLNEDGKFIDNIVEIIRFIKKV